MLLSCFRYEITIRWAFREGHIPRAARPTISTHNDVDGICLFPTPPHPTPYWCNSPQCARASTSRLHDHTQRHTTVGRSPLDEWPARRRNLYLTTHNNYRRQTSMPLAGFEPTIPASERPQTHASHRAATNGIHLSIESHYEQQCFLLLSGIKCKLYVMWWHLAEDKSSNITREGCLSARYTTFFLKLLVIQLRYFLPLKDLKTHYNI